MVAENAGISLVNMALAFMLAHPAVTAPIIGPRTMEQLQSQLDAVDVTRGTDVQTRSAKSFHPASPSHAQTTATCRQHFKTPSYAGDAQTDTWRRQRPPACAGRSPQPTIRPKGPNSGGPSTRISSAMNHARISEALRALVFEPEPRCGTARGPRPVLRPGLHPPQRRNDDEPRRVHEDGYSHPRPGHRGLGSRC